MRTERYKLIHYYSMNEWELFDLKTDPREMKNVYSASEYQPVVRELKTELARLRKELKVPDDPPAEG